MKQLSIFFCDFWPGFDKNVNFIIRFIKDLGYSYALNPKNPDYLFYSSFGLEYLNYPESIKVYYTGENNVPDFNFCDYAMAFQHLSFEDRYCRLPIYLLYDDYYQKIKQKQILPEETLNRKFCNFVYSNAVLADPFRELFFSELSRYKKVDSGGKYLNNIGGPIKNKLDFIHQYKFTIAFENSSTSGYTTEKLIEPMVALSLPIYWGNPQVEKDFNTRSFIYVNPFPSIKDTIDEIIYLDTNDEAYLKKLSEPWVNNDSPCFTWKQETARFLRHIFEQPLEKAKRIPKYGYVSKFHNHKSKWISLLNKIKNRLKRR